ncbi:MAG: DedA family protein [Clostridia bacterium]|nr:DedA family protein [Clostridia bacterium]
MEQLMDLLTGYGVWGLAVVAFVEASFFPVPPDVLLIPLALMQPSLALVYAVVTTLSSTAGGLFGRWIGLKAGRPLLARFASGKRIQEVETWFERYGGWAVAFAALTPVPYKVFTIAAGVFRVPVLPVLWGSLGGRAVRFFFEALVIMFLGEKALDFLARYTGPLTLAGGLLLVAWLVWRRRRRA